MISSVQSGDKNTSSIDLYLDKRVKQNGIKAILQSVKHTTDVCGVVANIAFGDEHL